MKLPYYKTISLIVSVSLIFQPPIVYGNTETHEKTLWEQLGCYFGFMNCEADDRQKIEKNIAEITVNEPDFATLVQQIRYNYEEIEQKGSPEIALEGLSMQEIFFKTVATEITKDLPEDVKKVISTCIDTTRELSTATKSALSGTTLTHTPNTNKCEEQLLEKEKEVATKLVAIDKDIQEIKSDLDKKQEKLFTAKNDEERQQIIEEIAQKEGELVKKQDERGQVERDRIQLQIMRMFFGLALITLGLSFGGPLGMVVLMTGLQMMASPSGGQGGGSEKGGRDNHPSSSDLRQETERSQRDNLGSVPNSEVSTSQSNEITPDSTRKIVQSYDKSEEYDVIPVNEKTKVVDGYFLIRNKSTGHYILEDTKNTGSRQVINPNDVIAYQPRQLEVPKPFQISQLISVNIDEQTNECHDIGVHIEGHNKTLFLVKNPKNRDSGWYLANAQIVYQ